MREFTSLPYLVFLLLKKDASRKRKLLEQPILKKGSNSKLRLKKSLQSIL